MKEYYYYLRDEDNHPRITVCLIAIPKIGGHYFHRGISLCSMDEKKIDKKYGRKKARSRALHAYYAGKDTMPIENPKAIDIVIRTEDKSIFRSTFGRGDFKSQHLVKLTEFERKLVG